MRWYFSDQIRLLDRTVGFQSTKTGSIPVSGTKKYQMDFKVGQNVLTSYDSRIPLNGDFFQIVGFLQNDREFVLLGNVENGHAGNPGPYVDENGNSISDPRNGSENYYFVRHIYLVDPNNIEEVAKIRDYVPQSFLEKLGL